MRTLRTVLLALTLAAAPLRAQLSMPAASTAPVTAFTGTQAVSASYNYGPTNTLVGPFSMQFGGIFGSAIADVYCVDLANGFADGQSYTANLTVLSNDAAMFASRTRIGMTFNDGGWAHHLYVKMAWLAGNFDTAPTTQWQGIQGAIWSLMGGTPNASLNADVDYWMDLVMAADLSTVDQNAWAVVTDASVTGPNGGAQEFLVRANVVPEPSTYALMLTGIAGLALVARRRRRV